MTAQEVIDLAKNGELKTLAVKDDVKAVIGFINLGLIELYKRFPIETNEYLVQLQEGVEVYTLPDDFMWLVAAYAEVPYTDGDTNTIELPINSEEDPLTINTVSWNKVQIPAGIVGEYVSLIYTASPKQVTTDNLNEQLPIPTQMIEALLNYMGYRGHGSVNGSIQAESNTHYQRFELSVKRLIKEGMFTSETMEMKNRIASRGFI